MLVCMFQKSCPCGGFFKTLLPVEGFWVLSWYVCMCKEPHGQRDSGYLDRPPYPPSQILKNWIKRQILKGFRKESDLVSRAWIWPEIHTSSASIHTSPANIHTNSVNIHTCLANIRSYGWQTHTIVFKRFNRVPNQTVYSQWGWECAEAASKYALVVHTQLTESPSASSWGVCACLFYDRGKLFWAARSRPLLAMFLSAW